MLQLMIDFFGMGLNRTGHRITQPLWGVVSACLVFVVKIAVSHAQAQSTALLTKQGSYESFLLL